MAIKSKTNQAVITATTAADVLVNSTVADGMYIGQIDVINKSTASNTIELLILSGGVEYLLLKAVVEQNGSRVTDERKIPYELKLGDKLQARLATSNVTGMVVHVSYMYKEG